MKAWKSYQNDDWPADIARAHGLSSILLFILFGIVSLGEWIFFKNFFENWKLGLLVISFINGWRVLNKDKQLTARQIVTTLFFIGSFISPIFGRFFRSSLDFKYFISLVGKFWQIFETFRLDSFSKLNKETNSTLVDHRVVVPKPLIMNIYAISVFGTAVTLPIMLIIFKFSTLLEVGAKKLNPFQSTIRRTIQQLQKSESCWQFLCSTSWSIFLPLFVNTST